MCGASLLSGDQERVRHRSAGPVVDMAGCSRLGVQLLEHFFRAMDQQLQSIDDSDARGRSVYRRVLANSHPRPCPPANPIRISASARLCSRGGGFGLGVFFSWGEGVAAYEYRW